MLLLLRMQQLALFLGCRAEIRKPTALLLHVLVDADDRRHAAPKYDECQKILGRYERKTARERRQMVR